ncbi:hypothetical protein E2C01_075704 [Portunus trituberculatus]|uniref:Uncharacterized protein n=1 Tax=Portunus trituberculatus TaxID=210409 RepID=A0A5B7IL04_PORTR|nr:hypothetical protein [Portunus trituberculatus]
MIYFASGGDRGPQPKGARKINADGVCLRAENRESSGHWRQEGGGARRRGGEACQGAAVLY